VIAGEPDASASGFVAGAVVFFFSFFYDPDEPPDRSRHDSHFLHAKVASRTILLSSRDPDGHSHLHRGRCIVYSLVLPELWNPEGVQKLADLMLHDLVPLLYVACWFVFIPKSGLRWKHAL
jgi:hypothetical protein